MNYEQASAAMEAHLGSNWTYTPVAYMNLPFRKPSPEQPWARWTVNYNSAPNAALGNVMFRRLGNTVLQIFAVKSDGPREIARWRDRGSDLFEGVRLPVGTTRVKFTNVVPFDVGNTDDGWFQINVTASIQFDQFR